MWSPSTKTKANFPETELKNISLSWARENWFISLLCTPTACGASRCSQITKQPFEDVNKYHGTYLIHPQARNPSLGDEFKQAEKKIKNSDAGTQQSFTEMNSVQEQGW